MAEQTSASITIHSCQPRHVRAVLDVLDSHNFVEEDEGECSGYVKVGGTYRVDEQFPIGDAEPVGRKLIEAAPEVSFTVCEQPAYNRLGTVFSYVPELGVFHNACDATGTPMLSPAYVQKLAGKPAAERRRQLGLPWPAAIATMPYGLVLQSGFFIAYYSKNNGQFAVVSGKEGRIDPRFERDSSDRHDREFSDSWLEKSNDRTFAKQGYRRINPWITLDDRTKRKICRAYPQWHWRPRMLLLRTVVRRAS